MKIKLLTTLSSLIENERIGQEVEKLGHEFELIDLSRFGFVIGKNESKFTHEMKEIPDLIILRGIFSSIKPISTIVNHLRSTGVKVFDNNLLVHQYSIDKVSDLLKLSQAGVSIPKTVYMRDFNDIETAIDEIGFPMIVKSTRMGKGAGVIKIENEDSLNSFVESIQSEDKEAKGLLFQEFIEYQFDLRVLIIGDNAYTMRRIPKEGDFRANFSLGGSVETFDLSSEDEKLARKALEAVDLKTGGVDILIAKDAKRYVLEVNHTAGMVGMETATNENITKSYVEFAIQNAK